MKSGPDASRSARSLFTCVALVPVILREPFVRHGNASAQSFA
ncbi:MAG: hypothetical protein NTY87_05030 [Planctomycetia bacterium]|nr:hypothetical protein [Planctomycetia bacterium]